MKTNLHKAYFHTKDKWVKLGDSANDDIVNQKPTISNEIYKPCFEYWDNIKKKFGYNHLFRTRVLKLNQRDMQDAIHNKKIMSEYMETRGKSHAMYLNESKFRATRGEDVNEMLNGEKKESRLEKLTEESQSAKSKSSSSAVEKDVLKKIKRCLTDKEDSIGEISPEQSEYDHINETKIKLCSHFAERKCRQLFTDPDCLEEEESTEVSEELTPKLTEFERCMHELHELGKKPDDKEEPKVLLSQNTDDQKEEDPWVTLAKCQLERYGFADPVISEKEETKSEAIVQDDFYQKIINNLMEKDVRMKGVKIKVENVINNDEKNVDKNARFISVTLREKDGEFVKGIDLRSEQVFQKNYEGRYVTEVLDTLVGKWKTMGLFLKELADSSKQSRKKMDFQDKVINALGLNVAKMVSEMLENKGEGETQDLSVEIKFNNAQSKSYNLPTCKEQDKNLASIKYREKKDYAIKGEGDKRKIMRTITKQDFNFEVLESNILPEKFFEIHNPFYDDNENHTDDAEGGGGFKNLNHRGLVELITGSKYAGSWNQLGMDGCGIYISPGGTMIDGRMVDGVLHGPATVYFPNGIIIEGAFDKGKFHSPKITFGDGLEYKVKNWNYLNETKKLSKSEILNFKPILDRDIPNGHYDCGEGFYNPETKIIYHSITMKPLRTVSAREHKWITSICRAAKPSCVSLDEHLYEVKNIAPDKVKKKEAFFTNEDSYQTDCRPTLHYKPTDNKTNAFSLDRLIEVKKKSKPIEEIWNNIRELTDSQTARVGVPFSYEQAVQYTCTDQQKKNV